jgi:hypothetical protein
MSQNTADTVQRNLSTVTELVNCNFNFHFVFGGKICNCLSSIVQKDMHDAANMDKKQYTLAGDTHTRTHIFNKTVPASLMSNLIIVNRQLLYHDNSPPPPHPGDPVWIP